MTDTYHRWHRVRTQNPSHLTLRARLSDGPGGEPHMTVAGGASGPGPNHIAEAAANADISPARSREIIERIVVAMAR